MKNKIKDLEEKILHHKELYYQGIPEISDAHYDQLEEALRSIDPTNKVLELVGAKPIQKKVQHATKMLSLNKTYKLEELLKWKGDSEILSTLKVDGVSCSLIYENGNLVLAKTRGDGSVGEDITQKIIWIKSIPKRIKELGQVEIRGELLCEEESFNHLASKMKDLKLDSPQSQRNIVAGLILRKDHIELCRYLNFMAFDYISEKRLKKEEEKLVILKDLDFFIPDYKVHTSEVTISSEIEKAREFMIEGHYQVDGLVFSFNDIAAQEEMGQTAHHPRFKMAFKFEGQSATTRINEIIWSISRNGIFTPVADVEPVELSGATINRVTLHNFGQVRSYNLKSGDQIEIIRSGEVIPKFLSVIKATKGDATYPKICPYCHGKIIEKEIRLVCPNENCSGRNREIILNFIQKMGIEEISGKRLDEMIGKGLVKKIADLYTLRREDFLILDKVKEKLADKFVESINKTRSIEIETLISALGVSGGAFNKAQKLVNAGIDTIEKLKSLTFEQLVEVESFAEKSANDFLNSLREKHKLIDELLAAGVKVKKKKSNEGAVFYQKQICITGSLSQKRSEVEDIIRQNGGIVSSSVSKNTSYLLTNDDDPNSSKGKKAKSLGVPIINEDEFQKLLTNK